MITQKIRRLRELRNYSQEYMAAQLGISQNAYSRMENGETKLDVERLRKVAELLEVGVEELLNPEALVFNTHNQHGSNGLRVEHHQSGISEEALRLITERYEAQLVDLRAMNDRLLKVVERLGV
ncbi:MAG: helix-turn-helix domain-containing protein [Flavobacteriales bacterium]